MTHDFNDVRAHHLVPRRDGRLGNEPTYVQACECGATYRHGQMYPPPGVIARPYDREAAIEAALVQAGLDAAQQVYHQHGYSLGECKTTIEGHSA